MVIYTPTPLLPATLTPCYEYLDHHLDTISHQMDEMMVHFCTLATPGTPDIRPVSNDSTIATEPSPHDDVPADLFSDDDDSTCCVEPVVDCCVTPCHELSWFLGAKLIHWNDRLLA
jgi:hypothetical protein